jgi:hypothetical protein
MDFHVMHVTSEKTCCVCDIGNAFLYGKTKEKVYISAGTEFGVDLHGKI